MPAEEMGKVSYRLRLAFAVSSVIFVIVLAISPVKDLRREWEHYERDYVRFAQTRPDTKHLLADFHPTINQIWIPQMGVVDRCTTCHQGIAELSLADASVPQPFRTHPVVPHNIQNWGCVVCHRGQGPATEVAEAHETTLAWEQPMLPAHFIQGACGACHHDELPETPQLNRGRQLLAWFNCTGCHTLQGIDRPDMLGPDLTNVGTKVSREWIYKWLKEPRTIIGADGNVTVDGVETEEETRMPKFPLSEQELRALSAFLSTQRATPIKPYQFDPHFVVAWSSKPDLIDQGELHFRQMFCSTCHGLAVTRAGETKLVGGDIGPELTKVGSKVKPEWLLAWLRNPQSYLPHSKMPRYEWSDQELYQLTQYIQTNLTDPDLLSDVPQLGVPTDGELRFGRRLFTEKGCAGCHLIEGIGTQKDFGPDLSGLGGKSVSQLSFGESKIPRSLISYIKAKVTDPLSVNPAARMPQFHLTPADLDAVTTALLSMTGTPAASGIQKLTVQRRQLEFHPAGEFGKLYERYKCYDCHKFNGYGGTLAPDLSFEGSRARREWLIRFLQNPQTLRPTLIFRMPRFNISDRDAGVIADYIGTVLQSPEVDLAAVDPKEFTPQMAMLGKQLFEVKFQCQACHTVGASGGYVGPSLNDVGNWLTPAWMEAWLRNPQALVPETIEPHRAFTENEIKALTSYLLTLKQSIALANPRAAAGAGAQQ